MKTTKVFIGLFSVLAVANLFLSEWLIFGYAAICLILSVLLLHEERKNAQLAFKLTDAEIKVFIQRVEIKKLTSELDAKKAFEESQRVKQFELLVEISDLKTQLEKAKANSYTEIERKRGREKYNRLYKGKKKVKQEPYTIEGKTIKQLVEENLGLEMDLESYGLFYLCGYDKEFENCDITANWSPFLVGNNSANYRHTSTDDVILKQFSNILWRNTTDVISAIKKHHNIK